MGDWPDVREHAAVGPAWEGSDQRRRAFGLNSVAAARLGPGELAGAPFDECLGFRRDVKVFFKSRVRLADLGVSEFDEQPIALMAQPAGKVETDDNAPIR